MNALDPNLVVIALTIIALVAIAHSRNELAEKAIAGLTSLTDEAIKLLRRMWE